MFVLYLSQKPSLPSDLCVAALKHHPRKAHSQSFGDGPFPAPISQTSLDSDDSDSDPVTVPRPASLGGKSAASKVLQAHKDDSSSSVSKGQSTSVREELIKSTDSEVVSDEYTGRGKGKKTVAIDTTQNEHFSQRLIPAQSPEFDNVINQVSDSEGDYCQSSS